MSIINWIQMFENNEINLEIAIDPVSVQNKKCDKKYFKNKMQKQTKSCPYIIVNTCFIQIDYHCHYYKRYKNHGSYDIDNIVKPILDSLNGVNGIIIDDYLFDRVDINWIDTIGADKLSIRIYYPEIFYFNKNELVFYKNNNWCWPFIRKFNQDLIKEMDIKHYFDIWNKILDNSDYYKYRDFLPIQRFVPFNKLKDKEYEFIEIQ